MGLLGNVGSGLGGNLTNGLSMNNLANKGLSMFNQLLNPMRLGMMSFPSSLNMGGNNMTTNGKSVNLLGLLSTMFSFNRTADFGKFAMDSEKMGALNLKVDQTSKVKLADPAFVNIGNNGQRIEQVPLSITSRNVAGNIEDPFKIPHQAFAQMNMYNFIFKNELMISPEGEKHNDSNQYVYFSSSITKSLFNPLYAVQTRGFLPNVPLLNGNIDIAHPLRYKDYDDCSINNLVRQSQNPKDSPLGMGQQYKYADFMYCKDLGKVSNNHMITLRRFAYPIGDHISRATSLKFTSSDGSFSYEIPGDVGRLITWFGTDDNKLEDILSFNYNMSWKPLQSKINEYNSKADGEARGPIGLIVNSLNPAYNKNMDKNGNSTNGLVGLLMSKAGIVNKASDNDDILRMYDKNKVYEPKNTVRDTHVYEGALKLNHEFKLTFSYTLRAYEHINPRSAFLDLIGNILEVTYRRGKFWGGENRIIGPPSNGAGWKKANALLDNAWDKLGGFTQALAGGLSLDDLMGTLSSFCSKFSELKGMTLNDVIDEAKKGFQELSKVTTRSELASAIKGQLKSALGRPEIYAMDSLLSDDNVGLWHVTIGNPFNPIAVMGNLIMTDAQLTHSGPLGLDDFPTEIKVTVTLKHAKSRDLTSMSQIYTDGLNGLYFPMASMAVNNFYNTGDAVTGAGGNVDISDPSSPTEDGNLNTKNTPYITERQLSEENSEQAHANDMNSAKVLEDAELEAQIMMTGQSLWFHYQRVRDEMA